MSIWNRLFGTVDKTIDLASEAIEDPDLRNKLRHDFEQLKADVYIAELNTKTHPLIDGLHKMGRQLLSWGQTAAGVYLLSNNPDINPISLGAVCGAGIAYNLVKGKGR